MTAEERSNDGVALWSCPECAFTFDASHTDTATGGYSCPVCSEADLESRLAAVERERDEARAENERLNGVISAMDDDADLALIDRDEAIEAESQVGDRIAAERDAALARIAAVEAAIPAILMPIEMLRHGVHCTMRQAIYDGARCSCHLTSQIREQVEAQIRAVLAASPTPTGPEPAKCEHGWTQPHNEPVAPSSWERCPGPATPEPTEETP